MGFFGRSKKTQTAPCHDQPIPYRGQSSHNLVYQEPPPCSDHRYEVHHNCGRHEQIQRHGPPVPQGWAPVPPGFAPYQPIFVSNNFMMPPPKPPRPKKTGKKKSKLQSMSLINIPQFLEGDIPECIPGAYIFNDGIPAWHQAGTQYLNQGAALYDQILSKFNSIVTLIDGERFSGNVQDLSVYPAPQWHSTPPRPSTAMAKTGKTKGNSKDETFRAFGDSSASSNYFSKVNLYANSKLPVDLQPVKFYIPTFQLLCLAAQYSERVYNKPTGAEREAHIPADWRLGTKAMVIKSIPIDTMNVIVFAIRGSQTFLDWSVNFNSAPSSPQGFLDDPGNLCHAGFLSVARSMIAPVASRLRQLLAENPSRASSSLLITGHSAGGAIAALLYSHMLSSSASTQSELSILTDCFRRIHCITFGAPPVSLLPLQKPTQAEEGRDVKKSLFMGFLNEGDPVTRADKAYVKSLLELYAAPAPMSKSTPTARKGAKSSSSLTVNKIKAVGPVWNVPPSTLSNAGRLVLLRGVPRREPASRCGKAKGTGKNADPMNEQKVTTGFISDEMLRGVVWGDPVAHMMKLYVRRIELLAIDAVTARDG